MNLKNKIMSVFLRGYGLLFGQRVFNRIIKENKDIVLVFTLENIGDQCLELAYLRAYQREHHINKIGVITTNPNQAIFSYFADEYDELVRVTPFEHRVLFFVYRNSFVRRIKKAPEQIVFAYYLAGIQRSLYSNNKYLYADKIEKAIYHIPMDTLPCKIKQIDNSEWIQKLIESKNIIPGKTVIFNPYANSQKEIPPIVYEMVAKRLKEEGYQAISSVYGNKEPINGTEPLTFGLDKCVSLADACGLVIGLRSGFMDLISYSKARIIAIDNPKTYDLAYSFVLEKLWPQNSRIQTYHFDEYEDNIKMLVDSIIDQVISA